MTVDGTRKGKWKTAVTAFARTPTCSAQIACDGTNLQGPRLEKGTCRPCEEAAKRKGKVIPPRGGEGCEE